MQLEAGSYSIDLVVKDRLSGKAAAQRQKLVLPVADLRVLCHRGGVESPCRCCRRLEPAILSEGKCRFASPSREFHATDNLIIFFILYNAAPALETRKPLVRVTVTLMKDGKAVIKPLDYELTEPVAEPVPSDIRQVR